MAGRSFRLLVNGGTPIPTYNQRPDLTGRLARASVRPEDAVINGTFTGTSYFVNPNALSTPAPLLSAPRPEPLPPRFSPAPETSTCPSSKSFRYRGSGKECAAEFRAEAFNAFNHPQFQGPDATVGASDFGMITSTVNNPRQLQLALKLYF